MIYGCLTAQIILTALHVTILLKVTNTMMEHYHDKGLLGWLDGGMASLHPRIVSDKQIGPELRDL